MSTATEIPFSFVTDLPMTRRALGFARARHGDQHRDADGATFLIHPVEVAALLARLGYSDDVVAAAVLHDVLEDTDAERVDLDSHPRAKPDLSWWRWSATTRRSLMRISARLPCAIASGGRAARAWRCMRRIRSARSREPRMLISNGLASEEAGVKLRRYQASLSMLEHQLGDSHLVQLLRFEVEALQMLPPHPGA